MVKGGPAGLPWVSDSMTLPSRAFGTFQEAQVLEGGTSATCLLWTTLFLAVSGYLSSPHGSPSHGLVPALTLPCPRAHQRP